MSISTDNETNRLFTAAFGEDWIRVGMQKRTRKELDTIESLAFSFSDMALHQLEALGRTLGAAAKTEDLDVSRIGWAIADIAENASISHSMGEHAQALKNPEYRKSFKMSPLRD